MLRPANKARALCMGDDVHLGDGVLFGPNVVVEEGTRIGEASVVEMNAVLGKVPRLARTSATAAENLAPLRTGVRVTVCANAVVYAGSVLADEAIVGDQAQVRERTVIGPQSVIGRGSAIDNDVTIGARVKIQTNVYITAFSVIEDDVFVGPGVTMTNDNTMDRHGPGFEFEGPLLRRACRVGGGTVLCPGVEIGEEAFVAAGALITADVPARAVVMGVPARVVREVPDADLLERWR
jgi:acetyltransferase-like isoleucine patch superfamily enzyme